MNASVQALSGARVLVVGATGFLGNALCRALSAAGADVHGSSRSARPADSGCREWWQGDVGDHATAQRIVGEVKPDVLFHLGGEVTGAREMEVVLPALRNNLDSSVNLLIAGSEHGCRRIVFAGSLEEPTGDAAAIPSSPYAASKWAASAYARMFHALYATPVVIGRVFMVYGPRQRQVRKLIPYTIGTMLRGEAPRLSGGTREIDWVYIDDAVAGLAALATAPEVEGRTLDIGSGELTSIRDLALRIAQLVPGAATPEFGAAPDRPMEQVRRADLAATRELTGWEPAIPLDEGLRRTITWYAGESTPAGAPA